MKYKSTLLVLILIMLCVGACAVRHPSIAHTHIGHAITGWIDTPGKAGLFVVAEDLANKALAAAESASESPHDIQTLKTRIREVMTAVSPVAKPGQTTAYGVRQALAGAVDHLTYAATSDDASQNVKSFADVFAHNATVVIDRCDLIMALGEDILAAPPGDETAAILTSEVLTLARANVHGDDANGDGTPGSEQDEYGLVQLRRDIETMIKREDPPYETVRRWYLFNLVRLPSGEWIFRKSPKGGVGGY